MAGADQNRSTSIICYVIKTLMCYLYNFIYIIKYVSYPNQSGSMLDVVWLDIENGFEKKNLKTRLELFDSNAPKNNSFKPFLLLEKY